MALTRQDAVVVPYVQGVPPSDPKNTLFFLLTEIKRLENTVQQLTNICPQAAISEPDRKLTGMIRWNKAPWDPIGAGDGLVKWNGSAWTAV